MKTRTTIVASCTALIACAPGNAEREDVRELRWSVDTLAATFELIRDFTVPSAEIDPVGRPAGARFAEGALYVADVASDRVAVLGDSGNVIRWIGKRGRGPGELYGVSNVAIRDDHVLVGEALNGRVSEFTFDGRFVTTYSSPFAAGALSASALGVFIAARSATHYASSLTTSDGPAAALRRDRTSSVRDGRGPLSLPGHDLIAAGARASWVFDQADGKICEYGAQGARGICSQLPERLRTRLMRYRNARVAAIESAMRLHVESAPLAKDMLCVGTSLVLLLPLPEMPVVFVDHADGTLTPTVLSSDSIPSWARRARSVAFDGKTLLLISDEGLGRLRIARRASVAGFKSAVNPW